MSDEFGDEVVDLAPAYEFTCPQCGTNHFVRGPVQDLEGEDLEEAKKQLGVSDEQAEAGEWIMAPAAVQCPDCEKWFKTAESPWSEEQEPDTDVDNS